ncbi:DNA polymerase lambda isoform X1 [Vigna umbellata]|uniref:DNA polymerase lambda isoform X1 n=1 Tax=Vigna umbellata TaxID=87088 RepID=UPI001F5F108B|nr:DNA polymerase lambda isoform X1 [Vigna umbellata]
MQALKHRPLASPWFLVEAINKESKSRKMAPKKKPESDPSGMFSGMVVFLVPKGVQVRRLQIWKERLVQMGAVIEERLCKRVTHVFAMNSDALLQQLDRERLARFKGRVLIYQWLEDCLKSGEIVSEDMYVLNLNSQGKPEKSWDLQPCQSDPQQLHNNKKTKYTEIVNNESNDQGGKNVSLLSTSSHEEGDSLSYGNTRPQHLDSEIDDSSSSYCPPDQNKNITEIFGKLVTIYRALGDDRRSFSYYKAIAVIEKLPFKIESADQINNLPSIGKSLKDHVSELCHWTLCLVVCHFERLYIFNF